MDAWHLAVGVFAAMVTALLRRRLGAPGAWLGVVVGAALGVLLAAMRLHAWPWDAVAAGLIGALPVALLPGSRRAALGLLVALGVSVAGLAGLELMARHALGPPMMAAQAYRSWRWGPTWQENACLALHPAKQAGNDGLGAWLHADDTRPLVLHLGDSMIERSRHGGGAGVVELLQARDRDAVHINAGFAGTGTDFQLALARRLAPTIKPRLIVLWVYGGNDLADLDRPYACCDQGPLLDWTATPPASLCAEPRWNIGLRTRMARSPPPWPLRQASRWSVAARHGVDLFVWTAGALAPGMGPSQGAAAAGGATDRFVAAVRTLDALAAAGEGRLIAVLLPHRAALEDAMVRGAGPGVTHTRLLAALRGARVPTLDTWAPLAAAVARGRAGLYRDREHPGPAGHALLAGLVAPWLASHGRATRRPSPGFASRAARSAP